MATKTKFIKLPSLTPPSEIKENTKARRAWLQQALTDAQAVPGVVAKIVGQGSYQYVSAKRAVSVEGRLRHRGHCQFCGNTQVVKDGVLVLHGYSRPGYGYVFNECPGTGHKPLEVEKVLTEGWYAEASGSLATWTQQTTELEPQVSKALVAMSGTEPGAYQALPREPERNVRNADTWALYGKALAQWAQTYPLHGTHRRLEKDFATAKTQVWLFRQRVDHFKYWLDSGVHGRPLVEEVVV